MRSRAVSLVVAFGVVLALSAAETPAVSASGQHSSASLSARSRWEVQPRGNDVTITWRGSAPLPIGASTLIVRLRGDVLGTAREVGNDAVLELRGRSASQIDRRALELWRGNERIDSDAALATLSGFAKAALSRTSAVKKPNAVVRRAPVANDPGTRGPYTTQRHNYKLPGLPWAEFSVPIEVLGEVTVPTNAPGARPLVLILHGRHFTCFQGGPQGDITGDWPCAPGFDAVPSHRGYRMMADLLASQGYMVVSISANGINGQDYAAPDGGAAARSALIRHHLAIWAKWSRGGGSPFGLELRDRIDMTQVVLVGHSRGGEGVARAAIDSTRNDPWKIRGIVPIGPTAFGAQVPAYVHTAVLLPYCDGDVSDLQGQIYVDGSRDLLGGRDPSLRTAVMVMGANHNFFNSEWTPGLAKAPAEDDWLYFGGEQDATCGGNGGNRLSPQAQQAVGATYAAALVQYAIDGDRAMLDYLDGATPAPPSALGADVKVTALGADRMALYKPGKLGSIRASGAMNARVCDGYSLTGGRICVASRPNTLAVHPHWLESYVAPELASPRALALEWNARGTARIALPRAADLRGRNVDVRIAIDPVSGPARLAVRLIDSQGRFRVASGDSELQPLPGRDRVGKVWAQRLRVRVPKGVVPKGIAPKGNESDGFDASRVVAIELVGEAPAARAYVLDVMAVGHRVLAVPDVAVPRVSVATLRVEEGDTPGQKYNVPITVDGDVTRNGSVWVTVLGIDGYRSYSQKVVPGATRFDIPVTFDGDDVPFGDRFIGVSVVAESNVVTSAYLGGIYVQDDEHWPVITVDQSNVTGTEATGLQWTLRFDQPMPVAQQLYLSFVAPENGREINSDDVDAATWEQWTYSERPSPPQTPSDSFGNLIVEVPEGATSATINVGVLADGVVEGDEQVALWMYYFDGTMVSLTGVIADS